MSTEQRSNAGSAAAPTVTSPLAPAVAQWVAQLRWSDVPEDVRAATTASVFQSIAGGVAGLDMPEMDVALAYARALGESGESTILGDGMKVPLTTSVFVNSVLWCALEQQEMHVQSRTHPHEVIVPVAMVLAEKLQVDGVTFLEAVLAGVETTVAFGKTAVQIMPDLMNGLPNTTSVFAGVGAAATAAKLMKLDAEATARAICLAANFGAGLTECLRQGTTEYHYSLGHGSVNGFLAAQLAAAGAEATMNTFEGGSGLYANLTGLSPEQLVAANIPELVMGRLGREWGMPEHIYKRYPVHFMCMPYVDATKVLQERYDISADDISAIRLTINEWVALCDGANLGPYTGREATRGAVAFMVAATIVRGRFGLEEVKEHDAPDVAELVARTTIEHFADASNDCWELVKVEIDDKEGKTYVYDSDVEGIPDYRLPMSELRSLAETALGAVLDTDTVTTVLDMLQSLETCADVSTLVPLLVRKQV